MALMREVLRKHGFDYKEMTVSQAYIQFIIHSQLLLLNIPEQGYVPKEKKGSGGGGQVRGGRGTGRVQGMRH